MKPDFIFILLGLWFVTDESVSFKVLGVMMIVSGILGILMAKFPRKQKL